jgi:hypothetical protein
MIPVLPFRLAQPGDYLLVHGMPLLTCKKGGTDTQTAIAQIKLDHHIMAVITEIEDLHREAKWRLAKTIFGNFLSLFLLLPAGLSAAFAAPVEMAPKQVEQLDRGVVAIHTSAGNFLSWRALATDPAELTFNVYRGLVKLNQAPLALTNFSEAGTAANARYSVRPVLNGVEQPDSAAATDATWAQPYKTVRLEKPADGVTPDGQRYSYVVGDGSAADLDGDGGYELIIKWQPTNAHDNSHHGYTCNTYLDAYRLDRGRLWRIDLGRNIRAGAHYTTFLAYDFDGDGKAEVMMKTADGTVDGQGRVIGNPAADFRNKDGYILDGPDSSPSSMAPATRPWPAATTYRHAAAWPPGATATATGSTASSAPWPTSTDRARVRCSRAAITRAQ